MRSTAILEKQMKTQLRISFLKHSVIIGKIREKSNKLPPCSWFLYFLRRVIRVNCGNWGAGGGRSELLMSFALRWPRKSSDLSSEVGAVYELRIANELRFFYVPFTHALFFRPPYALTPTFRISTKLAFRAFLSNFERKIRSAVLLHCQQMALL